MKTLKKLAVVFFILSIGFVFIPEKATAQNELQFSQVLTYTGTVAGGGFSPTYTVPSNKVWKVETILSSGKYLYINNVNVCQLEYDHPYKIFPFWLKAGDNIKLWYDPYNYDYFFTIIEYSVVAIQ